MSTTSSQQTTKAGSAARPSKATRRMFRFKESDLRIGSSKGPDDRAPLPYRAKSKKR